MSYTTLGVRPEHGERARALANHCKMPVAAYIGSLLDAQYRTVFGREPTPYVPLSVETSAADWRQTKLKIETRTGQFISVPTIYVKRVAEQIRKRADHGGASLDLDIPNALTVSRKGSGVVIEANDEFGQPAKITMSTTMAKRLCDRMNESITEYVEL